jgi:PAS domain S-box-containing protein
MHEMIDTGIMEKIISVLLVSDNLDDKARAVQELNKAFVARVTEIRDETGLDKALDAGPFDIVITDYHPGLPVLKKIKSRYPACPVIEFTTNGNHEIAVEAMKNGAHDVIVKSSALWERMNELVRSALKKGAESQDLRQAEEALRASEEKYRLLFETARDVIIFVDMYGNIVDINPWAEKLFGYPRSDLIRMNIFRELVIPEDHPVVSNLIQRAIEGLNTTYEVRYRTKEGKIIHFDGVTVSRTSSKGEFLSTFCLLRDITDRTLVEEKLRQSEHDLAEAQRVAGLGNWRFDIMANTVIWSEELYRIFDVEKTEFGGLYKTFLDRVYPDDKSLVLEKNRRARETGEPFEVEYRIVTHAGQLKHIREVGYAIKDTTGRVVGLFGTAQDITIRKKAEEELRSYQNALRALASELAIVEERERHKIATDLHENIGQALAIANIKLGALREYTKVPEVAGAVDEIRSLIEDAIRYTRSLTFELSPPILYELGLIPALSWLAEQFQDQHGIPIEVSDDERPKTMNEDLQITLYKAVKELLINVVKHAKAQKAVISLQREAGSIRITVEDDGIGFDTYALKTPKTSGFGLFNIRERLYFIGGRLEIDSVPFNGTKATIVAPCCVDEPART